jgi:hypothetical protein
MRKIAILLTGFLLYTFHLTAQTSAVTSNGEEVVLYNDGTWKYVNKKSTEDTEIKTNSTKFSKDKEATFLVKSNITNVGIYLNPKEWSFKKSKDAGEYEFQLKAKEGYGLLLAERIAIPLESLKSIALTNAQKAAPDAEIVKEEYRMVNGAKVLCLQMEGTLQGIRFSYFGYYYSSDKGTVQLLTYTSKSLFKDYRADLETFLNGFVELK